jgi:hypothetical protein
MPLGIETTVVRNDIPDLYAAALTLLGPKRCHRAMADEGKRVTVLHLRDLDSSRVNPLGGTRSHFYARFARPGNLQAVATDQQGSVVIGNADFGSETGGNPLWAHYAGATIEAKPGHALPIPVRAEAYGVAPRTFNLQLMVLGPKGQQKAYLVKPPQTELVYKQRKDGTTYAVHKKSHTFAEIFYLLLKKVTLKADQSVLPSEMEYAWAAERGLRNVLETFANRLPSTGGAGVGS